ncbi:MAG: DNA alkylation repair protein [Alistipes sp.]|jgi:hypothetical protein|nr:DNA alkylation repair protein [Alistipes sp.]
MDILAHLRSIADTRSPYREFNKRICATNYNVIGVRMPDLHRFAAQLSDCDEAAEYLEAGLGAGRDLDLGSDNGCDCDGSATQAPTHEEILLYGLVLARRARKMAMSEVFRLFDALIPHFDSWAHVDVVISRFKIFNRHRDEVLHHFMPLKTAPGEFEKRTFVLLLMSFFMDEDYIDATLEHLTEIPQGQYYVDMAIAWALSVALVKHYDRTLPLLESATPHNDCKNRNGESNTPAGTQKPDQSAPVFSRFVHNKAIQKARESYRVTPERKAYLNTLKIK